jgi:hypothetical protein
MCRLRPLGLLSGVLHLILFGRVRGLFSRRVLIVLLGLVSRLLDGSRPRAVVGLAVDVRRRVP